MDEIKDLHLSGDSEAEKYEDPKQIQDKNERETQDRAPQTVAP